METTIVHILQTMVTSGTLSHATILVGGAHDTRLTVAVDVTAQILKTTSEQVLHHPDVRVIAREYDEKNERMRRDIRVEDIRTMLRFAQESSFQGGAKVIIISEADRMNEEAYTSLLKTLEEPSAQTFFFLLYQTPDSIPVTIRSRGQLFTFAASNLEHFKSEQTEIFRVLQSDISTRFQEIEPWLEAAKDEGGVDDLVKHLELWQGALVPSIAQTQWQATGRSLADLVTIQDHIRVAIKALRHNAHPKLTLEALLVQFGA